MPRRFLVRVALVSYLLIKTGCVLLSMEPRMGSLYIGPRFTKWEGPKSGVRVHNLPSKLQLQPRGSSNSWCRSPLVVGILPSFKEQRYMSCLLSLAVPSDPHVQLTGIIKTFIKSGPLPTGEALRFTLPSNPPSHNEPTPRQLLPNT